MTPFVTRILTKIHVSKLNCSTDEREMERNEIWKLCQQSKTRNEYGASRVPFISRRQIAVVKGENRVPIEKRSVRFYNVAISDYYSFFLRGSTPYTNRYEFRSFNVRFDSLSLPFVPEVRQSKYIETILNKMILDLTLYEKSRISDSALNL